MSEHAAVMETLARIEEQHAKLADRLNRVSLMLENDLLHIRRDINDVMDFTTRAAPMAAPAESTPDLDECEEAGPNGRDTWAVFRDMPNRFALASAARRIGSMSIIGGFDDRMLSQNWSLMRGVVVVNEAQLTEMVEPLDGDWEDLSRLAQSLYTPRGWNPSLIGTLLALMYSRPDVGNDKHAMGIVRRAAQPIDGVKAKNGLLRREFTRAMDFLDIGPKEVTASLRLWAGHCEWAHPTVRVAQEEVL